MNWKFLSALTFSLSSTLYSAPHKLDEAWQPDSAPEIMSYYFQKNFYSLPLNGKVSDNGRYWSGDYWALNKGSINYRWYSRYKTGFNLNSPSKERAMRMSIPELAELSPSEKYDLFTGRYDYPLKQEVSGIADPKAEHWEGMCHGWSPAAMNHFEPSAKLMRNPDGIEIPFGSTDIKALISFYYGYQYRAPDTHQIGKRCFKKAFMNRERDCNEDLNAGTFHIVIANRLGLDRKGFIADLQRYEEVWNHPITAFESIVLNESSPENDSAPGTSRILNLKTTITYLDENGHDWQPVIGTKKQFYKKLTYFYKVELDSTGGIIGGEWVSKERPDFLWLMNKPRKFEGIMNRLGELLDE